MTFPRPGPGLIVRYSYLWHSEYAQGRSEGVKDRPCAIILVLEGDLVAVLPVTHSVPGNPDLAVEIPLETKTRLGLDSDRSWVVLTEANRFKWPGPDLRPAISGDPASVAYGVIPENFYEKIRAQFVSILRARRARIVDRDT